MGVNVSYIKNVLADSIVGFSGVYELPENFKDIKLTDVNSITNENFGMVISMSDYYLAVGIPTYSLDKDGNNSLTDSGIVFIFKRNVDTWELFTSIVSPTRIANENFGYSVSLTDENLVIGTNGTSKAYIYNIEISSVVLIKTLAEDSSTNTYGNSVFCSDSNIFISDVNSSIDENGNTIPTNSGSVFIYNKNKNWDKTQQLSIPNGDISANDELGYSIDIYNNNTIAISSINRSYDSNNMNYLINSGSVYILSINSDGFSLLQELNSPNRSANANFGKKVLFANNGLYISDTSNIYFYSQISGTYSYTSTIYTAATNLLISDYDINAFLCISLYSTNSNTAPYIDILSIDNITNKSTSIIQYYTDISLNSSNVVSTMNNLFLIGNKLYSSNTGTVNLLTLNSSIDASTNNVTYSIDNSQINGMASDRNANDQLGSKVSYNSYSNTIIASAPSNSYDLNIQNYLIDSGSIYVWKINNDGTLSFIQKIVSQDRTANANFGKNFSTNGNLLVIPDVATTTKANTDNLNVYKFNNGRWILDNVLENQSYNGSISTDGTNIAWTAQVNSTTSSVAIINYTKSTSDISTIDISFLTDSSLGHEIEISGNLLMVYDKTYNNNTGVAYAYKNINNVWTKYATLQGWGQARNSNDYFSGNIEIKNNYLYVSATGYSYDINEQNYISNSGLVYVYTLNSDGTYSLFQKLQSNYRQENTNNSFSFGSSIAVSDTNTLYVANKQSSNYGGWIEEFILINGSYQFNQYIGTPNTTNTTTTPGSNVWWYEDMLFISYLGVSVTSYTQDNTGLWKQDHIFTRNDITQNSYSSNDSFGSTVKYKNGLLLISAYTDNYDENGNNSISSAGSVYIYNNTPLNSKNVWNPIQKVAGQVFVDGKQAGDYFGQVVSYYNGNIIVSSPYDSYDENGENYMRAAGAVYVFSVDSDGNINQLQKIVPNNRYNDGWFGQYIKVLENKLYILNKNGSLVEFIYSETEYVYNDTISLSLLIISDGVNNLNNHIQITENYIVYAISWNTTVLYNNGTTWTNIGNLNNNGYSFTISGNYIISTSSSNNTTITVYKLNSGTITFLYNVNVGNTSAKNIINVYSKNNKLFLSDSVTNSIYVFDIISEDDYVFSQVLSMNDINNSLNTYDSTSSGYGNTVAMSDDGTLAVGFNNASYYINSDLSKTLYSKAGAAVIYKLSQEPLTSNIQQYQTFTSDSYFTIPSNATGKVRIHVFGDIGTDITNTNKNNYVCVEEDAKPGDIYRMFIGNSGVNSISDFNGFKNTNNKISGAATILRKNDDTKNLIIVGGSTTSSSPLDSYLNSTVPTDSTYVATGGNGYGIGVSGDNGSNGSNYIDSEFTVLDNFYYTGSSNLLSSLKTQFATGNYGSVVIEYCVGESNSNMYVYSQDITPQNTNDYNSSDQFGTAIDISNNLLVITSMNHDYDMNGNNTQSLQNSGAAWIYSNTSGKWEQEQKIVPTGTNARNSNDYFGANCKIFNGMAIVSSVNHSYDTNGLNQQNLTNVGAAWVWSKDTTNNTWNQVDKLCPFSSENATDYCFSIDKTNNLLLIGSPTSQMSYDSIDSDNNIIGGSNISNSGCVYILNIDSNNNITFNQKLFSPNPYINGQFGWKVKFNNNKIYVSEPGYTTNDTNGVLTTGAIYEYTIDTTSNVYVLSNTITTDDTDIKTLGYDFDIANDKMIIGCPNSYSIHNNGLLFSKYSSYEKYISCKDINSSWAGIQASTGYDFTAIIFKILLTFNNPLYITRVLSQINSENILDFYIDIDFSIDDNIKINMLYNGTIYKIDTNLNITSINGIDTYLSLSQTKNNIILTFGTFTYNISNLPTNNTTITTTYYIGNNSTYINSDEFVVKSIYSTWQPSSTAWSSYNNIVYSNGSFSQTGYVIDSTRPIGFSTIDGGTASIIYSKGYAIIYDITNKKILSTLSPKDYSDTINGTQFGYSVSIDQITSDIVVGFPSDNSISGSGIKSDLQTNIGSAYIYSYNSKNNNYTFSKRIGAYGNDQYYPVSENIEKNTISKTSTLYYNGYREISSKDSYIKYNGPVFGTPMQYGISITVFIPTDASTITRIFTQGSTYIDIDCTSTTPVVSAHYVYGTTNTSTSISSNASKGTWWWITLYYWSGNNATNLRVNNPSNTSYVGGTSYSNQSQSLDFYIGPNSVYDNFDNIIIGGIAQVGDGEGPHSYYTISDGSINYFDDYFTGNIDKNTAYSTTTPPSNITYIENHNVKNYSSSSFQQTISGITEGVVDSSTIPEIYEPVMYFPYTSDYTDHSGNNLPVTSNSFSYGTAAGDFPQFPSAKFMLTGGMNSTYSIPFNTHLSFSKSFSFCGWFAQWGGNSNNIKCDTFSIDITGGSASDEGYYGINLHIAGQALTISNIPGKYNGGSGPFIALSYDDSTKNVILFCNGLTSTATLTTSPTVNASPITYYSITAFSNVRIFGITALTLDNMKNLYSDINYNYPVTTFEDTNSKNYYNGIEFTDNTGYVKYSCPSLYNSNGTTSYHLKMVVIFPTNGANTTRIFSQPTVGNYIDVTLTSTGGTITVSSLGTTGTYAISGAQLGIPLQLIVLRSGTNIWGSLQTMGTVSGTTNVSTFTDNSSYIGKIYDTYIGNNSQYTITDNIIICGWEIMSGGNNMGYNPGYSDGYLSLRSTDFSVPELIDYTQGNTTTIYNGYPQYIEQKNTIVSDDLLITQAQSISSKSIMSLPSSSTGVTSSIEIDKNYSVIQQNDDYMILSYISDEYDYQGFNRLDSSGAVHIWTYDSTSTSYKFTQRITSPNRSPNGNFGKNIILDSNKLVVTAPGENLGYIYIYTPTGTSPYIWELSETIDTSSISTTTGSIIDSDLSNNQIVIGDPDYIDTINNYYGRVIICDKSSDEWKFSTIYNTQNTNSNSDAFGYAVKINGNNLAVKSNNILDNENFETGADNSLSIFNKVSGVWSFTKKIMNYGDDTTRHNYTQGQESDITLSIPNYLVSGTGISLTVYISSSCSYAYVLLNGNGNNISPQIVLNQNHAGNVSRGSIAFAQMFSSWNGTNMDNVLKFDDWNTINIYNNSGTLNLNVNGSNTTNTSIQTGITQFILNCNPHVVLGGVSYFTGASPVNTPYSTSNSNAYIDFSDMSSISVTGDTSLSIVTNNLIDNNTIINIPQKTISNDSAIISYPYTNGYTGTYNITIPNYLASGTGITIIAYIKDASHTENLFLSNLSNGPGIGLSNTNGQYQSGASGYWPNVTTSSGAISIPQSLNYNSWNTFQLYNSNGTIQFVVNGINGGTTTLTSTDQILLYLSSTLVIASIAYTKSSSVNYPFNLDPNVTSYIDFADPNNPVVRGDQTQLVVTSKSLTASTPIDNLPAIEITNTSNIISNKSIDNFDFIGNDLIVIGDEVQIFDNTLTQKYISSFMSESSTPTKYPYTNGYTGTYNITIPNYLASGTGISIVFYKTSNFSSIFHLLYDSVKGLGTPGVQLNLNQGDNLSNVNNVAVYADSVGSPQQYGYNFVYTNGIVDNAWNTIKLYNNNGVLSFSVNGSTTTKTTFEIAKQFIASFTNNVVIASIAYTTSSSVNYPFNVDPNVTSYIDFADPNNPVVHGDASQIQITSQSLTASTPIDNLPAIEITDTSGIKYIKNSYIDTANSYIWTNMLSNGNYNIHSFKIDNYDLTSDDVYNTSLTDNDYIVSSYNNNGIYITKDSNSNNSLQTVIKINSAGSDIEKSNIIYNGNTTLQNTIPTTLTYSNYILEDQLDELLYSDFYRYHIWGTNVGSTQQTTPNQSFYQNIGKYVKIYNGNIFTYCESDTYDEKGNMTGYIGTSSYNGGTWGNIGSVINLYKGTDGNYRYGKKLFGNLPTPTTGYGSPTNTVWYTGNIVYNNENYYLTAFRGTGNTTNNASIGYITPPTTFRQDSSYTVGDTGIFYTQLRPWAYNVSYKTQNIGNYIVENDNMYFSNWVNSFGNGLSNSTYDSTNKKWNTITTLTCNLYNGGKTSNMMYGANMGVVGNNLLITAYKANGSSIGKTVYSTGTGTAYVYNSKLNITRFLGNNDFTGVNYSSWQLINMYAFLSINENGILFKNAYYGYNSTVSSYVNIMQYSYDSDTDTISSVGILVPPSDGGISTANFTQNIITLTTKTTVCDCIRMFSGYITGSNNNSSVVYTITYPILINDTVYKYNVFYGTGSYTINNDYIITAYDNYFVVVISYGDYSYYVTCKLQDTGYSIYNVRPTFNTSSISNNLSFNCSSMFGIGIDSKIINVYGINDATGSIILKSLIKSNISYVTSLYADDDNIICSNTSYYTSANIGNTLGNTGSFFYSKYNSDYNQYVSVPYKNGSIGYTSVYLSGNGGGYSGGSIQVDNTQLSGGNGGLSFAPDDWTILESEYTSTAPANSDTDKNTAGNGGLSNNGADGLVVITDNNGNKTLYGFTNSDQTYIVPAGVTSITVKIWGAGGGASTATKYYGGAGAYTTGTISVSPSEVYTIIVGKGGLSGNNLILTPTSDEYSYGYGSYGAIVSKSVATGSGGGLSSIIYSGKIIAVAAGGGGAGLGSNGGAGCKNTQTYIFGGQGAPLSIPEKPYSNSRNTNDWFGFDTYIIDNKNILISSPYNTGDLYGNTLTNQSGCIWKYTLTTQSNNKVAWDISDKIIAPTNTYTFGSNIYNKNNNYIIGSSGVNNMCYITTYNDNFENQDSSVIDLSKSFVLNNSTYSGKIVYVATNGNYIIGAWYANRFVSESDDGLTDTGAIGVYSNSDLSAIQLLQEDGPINGTANNDYFGTGHLIYNNYILIGNNPSSDASRRKIQVFKDNGTSINYVKDLIEPISVTSSYYGTSIKLVNDIISVCDYAGYLYNYGMVNNDLVLTKSTKLDTSYNTTYNDIVSISSNNYIFGNPSDPRGSYTNQPNITGAGTINIVYNNITRFYSIDGISNGLAQTNDYFGTSVKFLNNNLFVIGSPGHGYDYNGNPVTNTGAIYSYILNGNTINNDTIISNPYQNTTYAGFGSKIKRSSDTSFVTGTTTNIVNILNRIGDKNWQTVNSLNVPVNGVSDICFNGKTLLIGNISNSYITNTIHSLPYNLQTNQGGIGIFNLTNGVWSIKDSYILNGTPFTGSTGSNFGHIVRYYNNTLVISAPNSTIDNKGNSVTASSGNIYTYMFDDYYGKGTIKSIRSSSMYKQYGFMLDLSKDGQIVVVGGSKNTYPTADSYTINQVTLPIIPNISSNISDIAISKNIISIGYEQYNDNTGVVQLYTLDDNVWKYNTSLQAFINENVYDKTNPNNFTNSPLPTKGDYTGQSVYMNSNVGLVYSAIGNATDQQGNISKTNAGAIFVVDVSKHITTN